MHNLRPTDAWVRLILAPVVAFVALAGDRQYLADFWHHLARGRAIVMDGQLLDHDIFTFTVPGQPFQDVNWLTQVLYYALFQLGGLSFVRVVNALIVALALGLLVNLCHRRAGSLVAGMSVGLATFLGLWQVLTIRPQTFSLLFFVVLLDVLERSTRRPWLLVVPPVVVGLWANMHGAFPAGILVLGGWLAGASVSWIWNGRETASSTRGYMVGLTVCLVVSAAATLVNPYGWYIYEYVTQTSHRAAERRIDEWVAPSLDQWIGVAFFVSLPLTAALGMLAWRRGYRPRPHDLILGAGFLLLAAGSVRMVVWWLLVLAAPLAQMLARLLPPPDPEAENRPTRGAAVSFAALLLVAILSLPPLHGFNPLLAFRATERIEEDLDRAREELARRFERANVFSRFEWGEYLEWIGYPRLMIFMDGRIEIYPDSVWQDYATVTTGAAGWEEVLDRHGVNALILDEPYHARTGLWAKLESSEHWQLVLRTRDLLLFVRR